MTATDTATSSGTSAGDPATRQLDAAIDALLAACDPKSTDRIAFRGPRYDHGLAWVHFARGLRRARAAPGPQPPRRAPPARGGRRGPGPVDVLHAPRRPDDPHPRHRRAAAAASCGRCTPARSAGASCSASRAPARTSPVSPRKAVRDGDEWVVNGQKVWNTMAHLGDWGMLVTRTDPEQPKHQGMTYFAVDMHSPGVEVRPAAPDHRRGRVQRGLPDRRAHPRRQPHRRRRRGLAGGADHADERAHGDRRRRGRRAARRAAAAPATPWQSGRRSTRRTRDAGQARPADAPVGAGRGGPAVQPAHRGDGQRRQPRSRRVDRQAGDGRAEQGRLRLLRHPAGRRRPGRLRLHLPPAGRTSRPTGASSGTGHAFLRVRANSIEGGTSEIMRNILGEQVLGLPGEPRVDKDVAWSTGPAQLTLPPGNPVGALHDASRPDPRPPRPDGRDACRQASGTAAHRGVRTTRCGPGTAPSSSSQPFFAA